MYMYIYIFVSALFQLLKYATLKVAMVAFKIWIGTSFEDEDAQNIHNLLNLAK